MEQLYLGCEKPKKSRVDKIKNRYNKPEGGIWTSPYCKNTGSEWIDYCFRERSEKLCDKNKPKKAYLLKEKEGLNLYTIDCYFDLVRLVENYPGQELFGDKYIDYEKVANDYDGIRLTKNGNIITKNSRPGLYGWDVEGTVYFDWHFEKVKEVDVYPFITKLQKKYGMENLQYSLLNKKEKKERSMIYFKNKLKDKINDKRELFQLEK